MSIWTSSIEFLGAHGGVDVSPVSLQSRYKIVLLPKQRDT